MTIKMNLWVATVTTAAAFATLPVLAQTATPPKPGAAPTPAAAPAAKPGTPVGIAPLPSPNPTTGAPTGPLINPGAPGIAAGCIIRDGTPGTMTVKDPTPISPTEIKFIDSVAGPQRSLWNPPSVAPKLMPSVACLKGAPIDIARMPAGVVCKMLAGNPAPSGGGAVKVVSCN